MRGYFRTADPIADAETYYYLKDIENTRFIMRTPVCTCCNEHTAFMNETVWYEIDDKAYCEECVRDRKMFKVIDPTNAVCKDCGFKDSPNYDVTFYKFGDDVVCDECLEKRLTECERDYSGFEA